MTDYPIMPGYGPGPPVWGRVVGLGFDQEAFDSGVFGMLAPVRGTPVVAAPYTATELDWHLFVNGQRTAVLDNPDVFLIEADGAWQREIAVVGTPRKSESDPFENSTLFHARPTGTGVELTWADAPDEDDFDAYLIYWDGGLGGAVDTLIATIDRRDERIYFHDAAVEGANVYRILYRDLTGNIGNGVGGDNGQTVSITLSIAPDPPTIDADLLDDIADDASRSITLQLTPPASTTGITAYFWAVNWTPLDGFVRFPETAREAMTRVETGAPDLTRGIWPGTWKFVAFSITKYGILSAPSNLLEFRYIDDGAGGLTLLSGSAPSAPTELTATPQAGGDIEVSCAASVSAAGGVSFEREGVEFDTQAFQSGGEYSVTDTGLADGTAYTYRARAYDPAGYYSEYSAEMEATSDATAPAGDQVLTARAR